MGPVSSVGRDGVSVIVPAYNEENVLEDTLDSLTTVLSALDRPYEIIVADDCSRDMTLEVALSYAKANPWVKVCTYMPNRGKGAAIRNAFRAATMPIVGYIDADIRTDAATLQRYLALLDSDEADVVIANKWDKESNVDYSFFRRFASTGYGVFTKALFWIPIVDTQCGFKFFRRSLLARAMPKVTVDRFGFDVELLAWCVKYGARIAALPIHIHEIRPSRVNHVEMLKMFKDLLVTRVRMWQEDDLERVTLEPLATEAKEARLEPQLRV